MSLGNVLGERTSRPNSRKPFDTAASCVVKHSSGVAAVSTALPGQRGPDGPLTKLGTGEVIRLHTILPNTGCFYIIVFAGNVQRPRPTHQCVCFRTERARSKPLTKRCVFA